MPRILLAIFALIISNSVLAHGYRGADPDRARIQLHSTSEVEGLSLYGGQLLWGYESKYKVNVHYGLELSQVEHQLSPSTYENYVYFAPVIEFSVGTRIRPYINMGFDLVDWLESGSEEHDDHTDVHIEGGLRFKPARHLTFSAAARSHNTIYHGFTTFGVVSVAIEF